MTDASSTTRFSFYFWMALAIAVTAFVGLSRTFFLEHWTGAPPLPLAVHLHGLIVADTVFLIAVPIRDWWSQGRVPAVTIWGGTM